MDSSLLSFTSSALTIKNMQASEMDVSSENAGAIWASNPTFLSAMFALFVTQSSKLFLKKQCNFRPTLASQGMPSARSVLCSALTTSVALSHGVADSLFPVSLGFSLIVMCNAVAVKRHVGYQAMVINTLLDNLLDLQGRPVLDERLEEDLGSTISQVFTGALIGSTVAVLSCLGFMLLR